MTTCTDNARTALITNALHFVGPPAVRALYDQGYRIVAHDKAFAEDVEQQKYLERFPQITTLSTDSPAQLVAQAWDLCDRIDVVISNDVYPAIHSPVERAELSDLRATLEDLVIWPFALMQAVIPKLKAQGKGNVILVTSCRTELPLPGGAIPDIARAGANALVASLSLELAPLGIPVNAIAPNYLYSEAYFPKASFIDDPAGAEFIQTAVPAGRLGKPEEMEELVSYLANMQGSFHTGTVIKFAGGWPAAPLRP